MAAVLVPPSACRTSQSSMMEFSPSALRSRQARSDLPTSLEISCVLPPTRPLTDSRSLLVLVDLGSIAYSAVTQPRPLPRRQRGTSSSTLAAQSTLVAPNSMSAEPSAWSSQCLVILMSRSWSGRRPSGRDDMQASVAAALKYALKGGAIWCPGPDPAADRPDPLFQSGRGLPAEIEHGPVVGQRAALQFAWPGR